MVENTDGQRVEIKEVVHVVDNNKATLKLVVGRDYGGISATGGGGGSDIVGEME